MNFNCGIKSISISSNAKKVYEELDIIRPKHISFSLMLAITADEYIKNHKKGLVKLDHFTTDEVSSKIPVTKHNGSERWKSKLILSRHSLMFL